MTPWRINWSSDAARFLSGMERGEARRIVAKLEAASREPQRHFSRLSGHDDYKLRVGDYRVIALLMHSEKTIFVEKISHRKNIYKK
ncbi:type II toxin-antitoxin system RelE/ParE family toxin [Candidatus Micrarchaeota archaeon]|nr:type II toxin-antitoxin system RelE/ParE family toxin [Candidatus Micrarchaeota archaeon]